MPVKNSRAAAYQSARNGKPIGWDFWLNGVKFDGWRAATQQLTEAKYNWGRGLVSRKDGRFYDFAERKIIKQARAQLNASGGLPVVWEWSDKEAATAAQKLFGQNNIPFGSVYAP